MLTDTEIYGREHGSGESMEKLFDKNLDSEHRSKGRWFLIVGTVWEEVSHGCNQQMGTTDRRRKQRR